jgi:hypothetical protein
MNITTLEPPKHHTHKVMSSPRKKKQKIEETWLVLADGDTSNTQPPVL